MRLLAGEVKAIAGAQVVVLHFVQPKFAFAAAWWQAKTSASPTHIGGEVCIGIG